MRRRYWRILLTQLHIVLHIFVFDILLGRWLLSCLVYLSSTGICIREVGSLVSLTVSLAMSKGQ